MLSQEPPPNAGISTDSGEAPAIVSSDQDVVASAEQEAVIAVSATPPAEHAESSAVAESRLLSLAHGINQAMESKDHVAIVSLSTEGIALYTVLRAASKVFLGNYLEAIADARASITLDPDHKLLRSLPFLHIARAHMGLGEFDAAFTMAEKGLDIDPTDWPLKQCLESARVAGIARRDKMMNIYVPFKDTFDGPEVWLKLQRHGEGSNYTDYPEFRKKIFDARKDNLKLSRHLREDKRFLSALGILLKVRFRERKKEEAEMELEKEELQEDMDEEVDVERKKDELSREGKMPSDMVSVLADVGPLDLKENLREQL